MGVGFFGAAMGALWADEGKIKEARLLPQFPARANSVIFLFMCGGVSHIDTFDPKDNKWAGKIIDAVGFGDNLQMKRPLIPPDRTHSTENATVLTVSTCRKCDRRHRGGAIDVLPRDEYFPA
jgi:hypothetical protein